MILLGEPAPSVKMQVAAMADYERRMLLKTISGGRGAGGLGATRMNSLRMIRTRLDNRERRAQGRGQF